MATAFTLPSDPVSDLHRLSFSSRSFGETFQAIFLSALNALAESQNATGQTDSALESIANEKELLIKLKQDA